MGGWTLVPVTPERTRRALACVALALLVCGWCAPAQAAAKWTFAVYMDGDNDLEQYAVGDFLEMAQVGSTSDVNIVCMMDRNAGYDTTYGDWSDARRGRIVAGDTPTTSWGQSVGEPDMGDPATLTSFVNWAATNYPADHLAVILWDHGGGWRSRAANAQATKGVCWDYSSGDDYLETREVRSALAASGKAVTLVGFDACLMGMIEVAYELRAQASVMVGSEKTEPGDGWPYQTLLADLVATPSMTAAQLGSAIVNRYYASYGNDEMLAAIDLTKVSSLATSVSTLGTALINNWNGDASSIYTAAGAVMTGVNAAVIAEHHGSAYAGSHGLAIYFPASSQDVEYASVIAFGASTTWSSFLTTYASSMSGSWVGTARAATIAYDDENQDFHDLYDFCAHLQPPLAITTSSPLTAGTVGSPYSLALAAVNGVPAYTWSITDGFVERTGTASYVTGGTALFANTADDDAVQVTLPFGFPFYGTSYTSAYICSNGFINFGSSGTDYSNTTDGLRAARRIAVLWDDLVANAGSSQNVYQVNGADYVAFRWSCQTYSTSQAVNCEAILHSNGSIDFVYNTAHSGLTATIGVSAGDGTRYTLSSLNGQSAINAGTVRTFVASTGLPPGLALNAATGRISGTPTTAGTYSFQVKVTDTAGVTALRAFDLTINAAAPAPTGVSATDTDTAKVRVTWAASAGATGYDVYRSTASSSAGAAKISGSTPLTGTTFDDTTAAVATTYWYWVKAINGAGASAFSTPDSGLRPGQIVLGATSVAVPEGYTQTFIVALAAQPAASVTVAIARSAGDADLTVTSTSVTFTAANWNLPRAVTLAAAEDADTVDGVATFRCTAPGWVAASLTATEIDNDVSRLVATPAAITVPEGGSQSFGVLLSRQPAGTVTVSVGRQSGDTSLRVSTGSSLTFTPANWRVAQAVTLTALDDADVLNGQAVFRAAATGWPSLDVTATEVDNDLHLVATPSPIAVPEGGTQTFSVRLGGQPSSDVVVATGRVSGDTSLRVSAGGSLTFTPANWNIAQLVTLTALEDVDALNGQATFRLGAAGWPSLDVTATEVDNDLRLLATPTSLTVPEGGTNTFSVRLAGQPSSDVVVATGRVSGDSSLRVTAGGSLTFTPANWNIAQLVTLTALEDIDALNGQATFRLGAAGWPSLDVTATEVDNDLRLLATPTSLTVPEGGTRTFSVRLAGQPAGSVVVSTGRVSGDSSLRMTAGGSLTFTPANWNVAQIVTIYALPDSDTVNGQATFRVSAPGWPSVDVVATEQEPASAAPSMAPAGGS